MLFSSGAGEIIVAKEQPLVSIHQNGRPLHLDNPAERQAKV
jgi:hypothetical protein